MSERIAFLIERGGSYVRRVPATDPVNISTQAMWWDCGNEVAATIIGGKLHIEMSRGLMDGSGDAVGKLARFLDVDASSFAAMYARLFGMVAAQPADDIQV